MAETCTVIWSGEIEKKAHDLQTRPAPELSAAEGHTGKTMAEDARPAAKRRR
jgi:hypothetical protein